MLTIYEGQALPEVTGSAVSVGPFDGVHRGHQRLLTRLRSEASERDLRSVAVTFDRHPLSALRAGEAPRQLTSVQQTLEQLDTRGVDLTYVLGVDDERPLQEPSDFVTETLVGELGVQAIVIGEDLRFGHQGAGGPELMCELGQREGVDVVVVPPVQHPELDGPITADAVRDALERGDIALATDLLGRPYEVRGVVEHGDHRGRTIGFPTANVAVAGNVQLPADGVYAGWYERPDGSVHRAAISIGRRPTFYAEGGLLLVEAFLLDFDGDLYGEHACVRVEAWLRGQTRFDSVDDLVAELRRDVDAVRRLPG